MPEPAPKPPEEFHVFWGRMKDPSGNVGFRHLAIRELLAALAEWLEGSESELRRQAAAYLRGMSPPESVSGAIVIDALVGLAGDRSTAADIRSRAVDVLRKSIEPPPNDSAVVNWVPERLCELVRGAAGLDLRLKTIRVLGQVGRAAAVTVAALEEALAASSEVFRFEAGRTLWHVAERTDGLPNLKSRVDRADNWSPELLAQCREFGLAGGPLVPSIRQYWIRLRNDDGPVPEERDEQFSARLQALGETDVAAEPLLQADPQRIEVPAWRAAQPSKKHAVARTTTTFFDGAPAREDFEGLLRLLGLHTRSRKFAVSVQEAAEPRVDGFLVLLTVVTDFALRYRLQWLSQEEYRAFPAANRTVGECLWEFIEEQQQRWGTYDSDPLDGLLGGDGDDAKEALGFGFQCDDVHMCRLWSRAWLVRK
jgi:hypothetical protein